MGDNTVIQDRGETIDQITQEVALGSDFIFEAQVRGDHNEIGEKAYVGMDVTLDMEVLDGTDNDWVLGLTQDLIGRSYDIGELFEILEGQGMDEEDILSLPLIVEPYVTWQEPIDEEEDVEDIRIELDGVEVAFGEVAFVEDIDERYAGTITNYIILYIQRGGLITVQRDGRADGLAAMDITDFS